MKKAIIVLAKAILTLVLMLTVATVIAIWEIVRDLFLKGDQSIRLITYQKEAQHQQA